MPVCDMRTEKLTTDVVFVFERFLFEMCGSVIIFSTYVAVVTKY